MRAIGIAFGVGVGRSVEAGALVAVGVLVPTAGELVVGAEDEPWLHAAISRPTTIVVAAHGRETGIGFPPGDVYP